MMAVMLHQDNTCDYVCGDLRCVCGRRMRSGAFWAPGSPASPFRAEIGLGCNLRGEVDRCAEELRLALRRRMTTVGVTRCWSKPDWNSRSQSPVRAAPFTVATRIPSGTPNLDNRREISHLWADQFAPAVYVESCAGGPALRRSPLHLNAYVVARIVLAQLSAL